MPIVIPYIDALLDYILDKWVQNNNRAITGTIGQNVVWNLGELLKKNPENWDRASIVSDDGNYTTQSSECIVIFADDSEGGLDFVNNIWNKWYFVNQTDNDRVLINGKFFFDINGVSIEKVAARSVVSIAKGEDDNWYQFDNTQKGTVQREINTQFVVGEPATDPLFDSGESVFQIDIGIGSIFDDSVENSTFRLSVDQGPILRNTNSYINDNYLCWDISYDIDTGLITVTMNQPAFNNQTYAASGQYT